MTEHNFLFTELNQDALTEGRAFDGVAFGTFTDMFGREIELKADDAADYAENTRAAIEATTAESGEIVGLPIDAEGHEKGDGAGWIVGVELVDGIIRLLPKWTEIGRELISKGIRRFFSATIDVKNKVVLGGTLTNWPATRDENNRVMLRPIELQTNILSIQQAGEPTLIGLSPIDEGDDSPNIVQDSGDDALLDLSRRDDMPDEIVEELGEPEVVETPPEPVTPPLAELPPDITAELIRQFADAGNQEPHELLAQVQQRANQIAQNLLRDQLEQRQQNWELAQLATRYTGGSKYGLPVNIHDLSAFLQSLDADQLRFAQKLFEDITQGGIVQFEEVGHGRRLRQRPLPEVYHTAVRAVLAAGNTVADFCQANGLNEADYDFSPFGED
jgi:hypothetical protein